MLRTIMNNLSGEEDLAGSSIGEVTIGDNECGRLHRNLSDILADLGRRFHMGRTSEKLGGGVAGGSVKMRRRISPGFDECRGRADCKAVRLIADQTVMAQSMADTMNDNGRQFTIPKRRQPSGTGHFLESARR